MEWLLGLLCLLCYGDFLDYFWGILLVSYPFLTWSTMSLNRFYIL